ncbi:hypothetical protein ACQKJG_18910 [Priestia megaterium]|uniref:DUF4376 domain-containing protein n=1 Tax=Priestia megaterium TaxID=1404 RepID=UPI003D08DBB4
MNLLEVTGTDLELRLIEVGFKRFSIKEKNELTKLLANRINLAYTDITEDYIFNHAKKLKADVLAAQCEEAILKGFTASNGHTYRTNRDDQVNMIGQYNFLSDDQSINEVAWKTVDEGYVMHSREEWLQVYAEAFTSKKEKLFRYDYLKKLVDNAKTDEELVAVSWE